MLLSFGMVMISLYQPNNFKDLMTEISRGYRMGSHTPGKLIAQKWDQLWDVQVSEIREHLGVNSIL